MKNNSPWLWGADGTAANMTAGNIRGVQFFKGKRKKGQSNPSTEYTESQWIASILWPLYRGNRSFINLLWQLKETKETTANAWFKENYGHLVGNYPTPPDTGDLTNFKAARGVITTTSIGSVTADLSVGTVAFAMSTAIADETQDSTDLLHLSVYNVEKATWSYKTPVARSTVGAVSVALPAGTEVGDHVVLYTAFEGGNPLTVYYQKSSDSVNTNQTVVA